MNEVIQGDTDLREFITNNMTYPITFTELRKQAKDIQNECKDYIISTVDENTCRYDPVKNELAFFSDDVNENAIISEIASISKDILPHKRPMSRFSMGQLCNKLGISVRYIEKCINDGRIELASDNVNEWLSDYGKSLYIRTHRDKVRGILSDRYTTLDTPEILDVVADVVDPENYAVKGHFLTPERFHARIVHKDAISKVDDLFAGIQIDSSDVGRSTLTVKYFIYKQVCTNGLIIAQQGNMLFSQKHIGMKLTDFKKEFVVAMEQIPILTKQYQGVITKAQGVELVQDDHLVEDIMNRADLSKEAATKVLTVREEKYPATYWGIINAVTEVAQDYTLERRLEIERAAGDMLLRVA